MRKAAGLFALCWLLAFPALAATDLPKLTGRVVDEADLLPPALESAIADALEAHEKTTGNQVVVVTLKSLQGQVIEEYGYKLGRHWGIGQKGKNNGALFITAPVEKQVRIEVGYGLEGTLTDALSSVILQRAVLPYFKTGDYAGGIAEGTMAILSVLENKPITLSANVPQHAVTQSEELPGWAIVLIVIFIIIYILMGGRGIGGIGRGGGFGGGGGFRGGGGSFGGGGSSGRW